MTEVNYLDLLVQIAEKNGGMILGVAADTINTLRGTLSKNFAQYFHTTIERCSHVTTVFNRSAPEQLVSLYVRTYLEFSGQKISDRDFRESILNLHAHDSTRIFQVIGSGGSGKTFLLRWLFLNLLENRSSRIPF